MLIGLAERLVGELAVFSAPPPRVGASRRYAGQRAPARRAARKPIVAISAASPI